MVTQRWPTAWLLTDERMGDGLWPALERAAAAEAGIIVRHHTSPTELRREIGKRVSKLGATLGISLDVDLAEELDAALVHNPARSTGGRPYSLSVHDEVEARAAALSHGALIFISPIFATRSHPGAQALGVIRAVKLAGVVARPAIALGGMDAKRGAELQAQGFHGWAGIDCWLKT